ncbi:MAG: ribonuclease HI [Clostridia bacterium]|nr:ribonuclease HI [Clostridia bacterium]MBR2413639.1 ribonuclease HI [Clostridia bacterium]MBR3955182.1 ribonuclease HI [Clostridia bacterium]
MSNVVLYTDGACSVNPGPGGYCAILTYGKHEKVVCGAEEHTTNNRMELRAVIEGLRALNRACEVTVVSDSKYVCDAINQHWLDSWQKNNWRKSNKDPVLNPELWKDLLQLLHVHNVKFEWIKGHDGHPYNERCDKIAVEQYMQYKK